MMRVTFITKMEFYADFIAVIIMLLYILTSIT